MSPGKPEAADPGSFWGRLISIEMLVWLVATAAGVGIAYADLNSGVEAATAKSDRNANTLEKVEDSVQVIQVRTAVATEQMLRIEKQLEQQNRTLEELKRLLWPVTQEPK